MKRTIYSVLLTIVLLLQAFLVSSCTERETSAKNFEYEETSSGIKITKYLGSDKKVIVPSIIENKKVVSIDYKVFSGNVVLEELTLPKTVENLSGDALNECDSLKELTFLGSTYFSLSSLKSLETLNCAICNENQFKTMRAGIYYGENLCNINIEKFEYISDFLPTPAPEHSKTVIATIPEELEKHIMSLTAVSYYRESAKNKTFYKLFNPEANSNNEIVNVTSKIRSEIIKAFADKGYSLNSDFVIKKGELAFPSTDYHPGTNYYSYSDLDYSDYYSNSNNGRFVLTGKLDDGYSIETDISDLFSYSGDDNKYTCRFNSNYFDYLFDGAVFYKEIDNSANMPICFSSRSVIVNGKNYSFIFG